LETQKEKEGLEKHEVKFAHEQRRTVDACAQVLQLTPAQKRVVLPFGMNMMTKVMLVQAMRPQAVHTSCNRCIEI
jgi:hypothetical protein